MRKAKKNVFLFRFLEVLCLVLSQSGAITSVSNLAAVSCWCGHFQNHMESFIGKQKKNFPHQSNNHLYLANLLGYSLEGFFNTDNCQNYWQNLHSWSLVRREGITGQGAATHSEAGQLLRHGGSSSPHPLQCYEQSNILPAPTCVMCRAK